MPPAPGIPAASLAVLGVAVVVMVSALVVMVAFTMRVAVRVAVLARVILMAVVYFRNARILVEDERLDRDRDGERGHAHAAEIDVIEVPEGNTVDHQHLGGDAQLVPQERAERLGDIAVQNNEQGLSLRERARQRLDYPAGKP